MIQKLCSRQVHTKIKELAQIRRKRQWNNHLGDTKVDKVNHEHGNYRKGWNEHLVSPSYVEQVVTNAEQYNRL
jgi:hypothetical protein